MFQSRTLTRTSALLITAVLAGGLMACSGSAAEVPQDENAQLDIWTRRPPGDPSEKVSKDLAKAFTEKTGIPTKVTAIFEDFETKLQQAAAQKDLPDIVINDTAQLGTLVEQGIVREVDPADIAGTDDITDAAWDATKAFDGKHYAVPFSAQSFALFIRSDWREAVGAEVPKSWDDLDALAQKFTKDDPDGNGEDDTYGWIVPASTKRGYASWYLSSFLWSSGATYFSGSGENLSPAINSPEAVDTLTWFQKSFCDKTVVPGSETAETSATQPFFDAGTGGIYLTGPYNMARFDAAVGRDKVEVVPLPAGPGGEPKALAEGENTYLMAGSANEAGQEKFAEFAASAKGQRIGMNGDKTGSIVRLPINTTVDMAAEREDERWQTFNEVYRNASRYVPTVPDWTPFRLSSAETFNAIASDCEADPKTKLDELAKTFATELEDQGAGS